MNQKEMAPCGDWVDEGEKGPRTTVNIRRRGGIRMGTNGTLPRRRFRGSIVRPPLPPKSDSLKTKAAENRRTKAMELAVDATVIPNRKFSEAVIHRAEKVTVPRSVSVDTICNGSGQADPVGLVEKRKRLFHQLSQDPDDEIERNNNVHKSIEKKPSFTSYVDLSTTTTDTDKEEEEEEDTEEDLNSFSIFQDSLRLPLQDADEKFALTQQVLARAEALVSSLEINDSSQNGHKLPDLFRTSRRISSRLESILRQSRTEENISNIDTPDLGNPSSSSSLRVEEVKSSKSGLLGEEKLPEISRSRSSNSTTTTDGGYLSDTTDGNNFGSRSFGRVKEFINVSFGKGQKKVAKNKRPVIQTPFRSEEGMAATPHLIMNEDVHISDDMFEQGNRTDTTTTTPKTQLMSVESVGNNRSSIISGSSSSSADIVLCDSIENDLSDLDPEARQERKIFNIVQEMMTSERDYVNSLNLITTEFKNFIESAKNDPPGPGEVVTHVIPDKDFHRIFNFLPEIQTLNSDLLKDFTSRVENWENEKKVADIIVKKGAFLKIYASYVQQFQDLTRHFADCCTKYPNFNKKVLEFESLDICRNLKVSHFFLKPVQRLPQYKLLLEQYLKNLNTDSEDHENALEALSIVTTAAQHANEKMKHDDNFKKLLDLQTRLGETDLIQANRELIKSGDILKISRSGIDQRYLILCTDILIYAKPSGAIVGDPGYLRTAYKIPLTSLKVTVPQNLDEYPLDFNIISPVRSCTLRAATPADRDDWVNSMKNAIENHLQRRATFSSGASFEKVLILGESAPVWVPDERVTMCQKCHCDFTLLIRRHHCRACGKVVCHSCSANRAPLKYRRYESTRVCDECFAELIKLMAKDDRLKSRRNGFKTYYNAKPNVARQIPRRLKMNANTDGAQMSGYLHQQNIKTGKFKKMWFVLKDRVIYVYKASEDAAASETIPVLGFKCDIESVIPADLANTCSNGRGFSLTHQQCDPLIFFCETCQSAEKWTAALLEAVSFD